MWPLVFKASPTSCLSCLRFQRQELSSTPVLVWLYHGCVGTIVRQAITKAPTSLFSFSLSHNLGQYLCHPNWNVWVLTVPLRHSWDFRLPGSGFRTYCSVMSGFIPISWHQKDFCTESYYKVFLFSLDTPVRGAKLKKQMIRSESDKERNEAGQDQSEQRLEGESPSWHRNLNSHISLNSLNSQHKVLSLMLHAESFINPCNKSGGWL